jgi:hypothetical protein
MRKEKPMAVYGLNTRSSIRVALFFIYFCVASAVAAKADPITIYTYSGNTLPDGNSFTAEVTLACNPCAGTYGSTAILDLSVSYDSVTFTWPAGSGAPTDPSLTLDLDGNVVAWRLTIQNNSAFPPYSNFILQTLNTTDPRYQTLMTDDGIFTGGIYDRVLFRMPPDNGLHMLTYNVNSSGTWVAVHGGTPGSGNEGNGGHVPVSEPSSMLLLGAGVLGLLVPLRRA